MKAPLQVNRGNRKWEPPDQEWIEYQFIALGRSARQLAQDVGCSGWVTQQWIKRAGLRKPRAILDDPGAPQICGYGDSARFVNVNRAWLCRQYIELDKSSNQIAEELGTSAFIVCKWLKKYDVPVRNAEMRRKRHSKRMSGAGNPAWNGGTAQQYQKRRLIESDQPKQCEWCGTIEELFMHHRNHDRSDGALSNLTWLCRWCNTLEGWLWTLRIAGRVKWTIDEKVNEINIKFMTEDQNHELH